MDKQMAQAYVSHKAKNDPLFRFLNVDGTFHSAGSLNINAEQLAKGVETEMEHTSDPVIARKIALDHLAEYPTYYTALEKMEEELEGEEPEEEEDEDEKESGGTDDERGEES